MSGGSFTLDGGFWGLVAAVQTPGAPWPHACIWTLPPDREPFLARSGHQRETGIESLADSLRARTRCEPGTARAPLALIGTGRE